MTAPTRITVHLPVRDLKASMDFFSHLGLSFDPLLSGEDGACLVIGENIHAMLLSERRFRTLIPNAVCDTNRATEVLLSFSVGTRARVDEIVRSAVRGGGMIYNAPEERGAGYGHGFQDLDGHIWEVVTTESAPERAR
jgi:predicted lactoylglutathione lyase